MVTVIKTNLFASPAPLEWATIGNGILFTAQIPIDEKGVVVSGGIEAQARKTLDNLKHTLAYAGIRWHAQMPAWQILRRS